MINTLVTTIFDEEIDSDVHIEIEWEFIPQPNGKPDPRDPLSEGWDAEPEIISVNVVEVSNPPKPFNLSDYVSTFESRFLQESIEIVENYIESCEDDFQEYPKEENL